MATITFHGAAQEVTGSCHLLQSAAIGQVLLDCGLHQGGRFDEHLAQDAFPFNPANIDAVILSHAHLDHSGRLPRLVHEGFAGRIYCAQATADLLEVMLLDALSLYMSELERENRKRARKDEPPVEPQYTEDDVYQTLGLCTWLAYGEELQITDEATLSFYDAGHILGSGIVKLQFSEQGQRKTLIFTGDLGTKNAVLMKDPTILNEADIVLMEGTYGDRNHRSIDDTVVQLTQIVRDTAARSGNILIPAFAVGRTQELLFYLGTLQQQGELTNWQVFLDSPMAIEVSKVYDNWFASLDKQEIKGANPKAKSILKDFIPRLFLASSTQESMAINNIKNGAIVIAGSGMCTGGRIRHHFKQRIWDKRNTVIFCGFQAQGTLGRALVDGKANIKIFGEDYAVRAHIETLGGFSAHAGQSELIEWVSHFTTSPRVVLVHGEATALDTLAQALWQQRQIRAEIPTLGQSLAF